MSGGSLHASSDLAAPAARPPRDMSTDPPSRPGGWRHPDSGDPRPLELEHTPCCLCGAAKADPVAVGEDFEYRTGPDTFLAVRCPQCELIRLDPRPTAAMVERIYPDSYHAFSFSNDEFGAAFKARSWLEARRLSRHTKHLGPSAAVVDIGCGDGFHLDLLRTRRAKGWRLEGIDIDGRAVAAARARGLSVHQEPVESTTLEPGTFDLALMIQTIEHVADPPTTLAAAGRLLRPGGRIVIVTDNAGSTDARWFRRRYWGGYHFPRHWNLFNTESMQRLARSADLDVERISTLCSPVNWVYSIRNLLQDIGAPRAVVDRFSLASPAALASFTVVDAARTALGRGALLEAVLIRRE